MSFPLFDCQSGFGGAAKGVRVPVAREECLAEMLALDISSALVRVVPEELEHDARRSNRKLYRLCDGHDELLPCPVAVPNSGGDFPDEPRQVADAIGRGAGAMWIRPQLDHWTLDEWVSARLFEALAERRLPLLCLDRLVGTSQVGMLAGRYPDLPIILAEVNYRSQRTLLPLLERFDNVALSIGHNYTVQGGIEQIVERVGAERLVFGTGFPNVDPAGAVTMLSYSGLSDEQKRMIGEGNMRRLTGGIER